MCDAGSFWTVVAFSPPQRPAVPSAGPGPQKPRVEHGVCGGPGLWGAGAPRRSEQNACVGWISPGLRRRVFPVSVEFGDDCMLLLRHVLRLGRSLGAGCLPG